MSRLPPDMLARLEYLMTSGDVEGSEAFLEEAMQAASDLSPMDDSIEQLLKLSEAVVGGPAGCAV
jgi:hypothetical protein